MSMESIRQRTLLIEGWRGINHSFAIVNQSQILALLNLDRMTLYHRDLPFAFPSWNRADNRAGLSPEDQRRVDTLSAPPDESVDCVYRICSPFRANTSDHKHKTVTFMVTELGPSTRSFHDQCEIDYFTRDDNCIVTASKWSRDRLVDWGFAAEKVHVISHGVDQAAFRPLSVSERHVNRAALGIDDDTTVFLNVGLPCWNKGIDLILLAFARLRSQGLKVRLILKDQKELYGLSVLNMIRDLGVANPDLVKEETMSAISVVSSNLSREELRLFYGISDCLVSPYRAEGFNLPVLEAIACGTPVIVTKGGATDDFCDDQVAIRIDGTQGAIEDAATNFRGRYIEPNLSDLTDAMASFTKGRPSNFVNLEASSQAIANRFTWQGAARQLAALTVGYSDIAA
jgi:glycosyltransferase involved in cell wall biosynthesis